MTNPPISRFLRLYTAFEAIVLVVSGFGIFFLPGLVRPIWPWDIAPFNAAFIGAIYLASVMPIGLMAVLGRWSPARAVLPMLLAFTGVGIISTLLNLGPFHPDRWATWAWFFLYITLPVNSAVHLWLYRDAAPDKEISLPAIWRTYLLAQSVVIGLYGLAEFAAPQMASSFWPWGIDAFHGQLYSGAFIATAVGAWLAARGAARSELLALGFSQAGIALFAIGGLALVDASAHRVDWASAGTWAWIGMFSVLGIAGLGLIWMSRITKSTGEQSRV